MASAVIGVGRERKGTMFLRSNEMNYGRAVLTANWHQAREGEPRDYDLNYDPVRDLRKATYHRLGTGNSKIPVESTYQDHFTDKHADYKQRVVVPSEDEREAERVKRSFIVLPRHDSAKYPNHYVSTQMADFKSKSKTATTADENLKALDTAELEHTNAIRRCVSQFTDPAGHRRSGRNTWQDESGVYANSGLKLACSHYSRTYTLFPGGTKPETY